MKSSTGLWRDVLFAARAVAGREVALTSETLADELGLEVKVASAWLSILAKYGYLRRSGKEPAGGRWRFVWELTRFGLEYRPEEKARARKERPQQLRVAANPGKKRKKE